jgi:ACS family hexuronate transporter-like MFS transporter
MTDPVWLFYLFWLPKFLDTQFGVKLQGLAAPLIAIYLLADVGSIAGGWMSSNLIARGWSVNNGRKAALLAGAVMVVPTILAPGAENMWVAVAIIALAAAAHQWWSCNLFTMVSDVFPRSAVASVIGIGGFAGAMSAMAMQRATGRLLDASADNYGLIFGIMGFAYLVALGVIHLLVPRIQATTQGA